MPLPVASDELSQSREVFAPAGRIFPGRLLLNRLRRRRVDQSEPVARMYVSAELVKDRQCGNALEERLVTNLGDLVDFLRSLRTGAEPAQIDGPSFVVGNAGGLVGGDQGAVVARNIP